MRGDRDHLIMFLTLVPAVLVIYWFFSLRTTGSFPVSMPDLNAPSIPVPSFLQPLENSSPRLQEWARPFLANWQVIAFGLSGGLIFGLVAVGSLADLVKALARWMGPTRPTRVEVIAEEEPDPRNEVFTPYG